MNDAVMRWRLVAADVCHPEPAKTARDLASGMWPPEREVGFEAEATPAFKPTLVQTPGARV